MNATILRHLWIPNFHPWLTIERGTYYIVAWLAKRHSFNFYSDIRNWRLSLTSTTPDLMSVSNFLPRPSALVSRRLHQLPFPPSQVQSVATQSQHLHLGTISLVAYHPTVYYPLQSQQTLTQCRENTFCSLRSYSLQMRRIFLSVSVVVVTQTWPIPTSNQTNSITHPSSNTYGRVKKIARKIWRPPHYSSRLNSQEPHPLIIIKTART